MTYGGNTSRARGALARAGEFFVVPNTVLADS